MKGWRPRLSLAILAGISATASTLIQLLTAPVLGLADNGDFVRTLRPLGLEPVVTAGAPRRFRFVWLHYVPGPASGATYRSTEYELVHIVRRAGVRLGFGTGFDVRSLAVVHAVLLGIAVWLIVRALPGPRTLRIATAALLVVALTDTRFSVYLNSFYSEPASMLSLLFLLAAVLHAYRRLTIPPAAVVTVTAAAAALCLSKSQDAILVVPVAVMLLIRRIEWPRLRLTGRSLGRLLPASGAIVLLIAAAGYLHDQPPDLMRDNRYNAVFVEILGHSADPSADLASLGLSKTLARYAGKPIYVPGNAIHDPQFTGFFTTVTEFTLAKYYATHPGRALSLADRGAAASMYLRPVGVSPPLGTRTFTAGQAPSYSSCKLCIYSSLSQSLRPAAGFLVPALWLGAIASAVPLCRRRYRSRGVAGVGVALLLLVAFAVVSMGAALLGEGAFELVKHLYLTSVCNALIAVLTIHATALLVSMRVDTRRPAKPAPT